LASLSAGAFRVIIMPISVLKTTLQVKGPTGIYKLKNKIKLGGPSVLWHGTIGALSATFIGHYLCN
jgi:hypothetical protein